MKDFEITLGDYVGRLPRSTAQKYQKGIAVQYAERRQAGIYYRTPAGDEKQIFMFWFSRSGHVDIDSVNSGAIFNDDVYEILKKAREYIAASNEDRFETRQGVWVADWDEKQLVYVSNNGLGSRYACPIDIDDGLVDVDLEEFADRYVFHPDDLEAIQKLMEIAKGKL